MLLSFAVLTGILSSIIIPGLLLRDAPQHAGDATLRES